MMEKQRWFVVITKPSQEAVARENLQRQGFDCFLPLVEKPLKRRRRTSNGTEALFPGYLFIHADPEQQSLAPIRSTRGVRQMVRFGHKLAVVPDRVIDLIQARISEENGLIPLTLDHLNAGDKVRLLDGPLEGLNGIFKEQNKEARAILLLNLLGSATEVEVDALLLERA